MKNENLCWIIADGGNPLRSVFMTSIGRTAEAEVDRTAGVLGVTADTEASVGLMLTRDDYQTVHVVVQDAATVAVLDQSEEILVKLRL
jgi:hypothetical protein